MDGKGKSEEGEEKRNFPNFDPSSIGYETYQMSGSYDYQFKIEWEMTSPDQDPFLMTQLLSDNKKHFAMQMKNATGKKGETGTFIYDFEKHEIIILVDSEKMAMVTNSHTVEEAMDDAIEESLVEQNQEDFNFVMTGKKKQILGYTCEQYTYTNEDGSGEVWITKDLKYSNYDLYSYMQQSTRRKKKQTTPASWEKIKDGFALESIHTLEDGQTVKMVAKVIDDNANVNINLDGYEAMKVTKK